MYKYNHELSVIGNLVVECDTYYHDQMSDICSEAYKVAYSGYEGELLESMEDDCEIERENAYKESTALKEFFDAFDKVLESQVPFTKEVILPLARQLQGLTIPSNSYSNSLVLFYLRRDGWIQEVDTIEEYCSVIELLYMLLEPGEYFLKDRIKYIYKFKDREEIDYYDIVYYSSFCW